jgi:hypothetical protein
MYFLNKRKEKKRKESCMVCLTVDKWVGGGIILSKMKASKGMCERV